ncbi:Uncharacterised protein [Serratia ficaria]|nr:Uncharacterised protein [Serratia ficaria]
MSNIVGKKVPGRSFFIVNLHDTYPCKNVNMNTDV